MRIFSYSNTRMKQLFAGLLVAVFFLALVGVSSADAKETIKIGFIGPLSGGNALQGIGAKNGFVLAIREANNSGDYPYHVEGIELDDGSQPKVGVHAALKIVNDPKVVAATCCWNSPVALATIPVFQRANIPYIIWGAISPKITEQNVPQVTRVTPTLAQENEPLAKWLVNDLGYKKIAILTTSDDYGENNLKSFKKFATQDGAEIVSEVSVPSSERNFKSALAKIQSKHPDLLYFGGVIAPAAVARKQMVGMGFDVPLAGISGIYDQKFIELAGKAADGTLVTEPKIRQNPKLEAFEAAYKKADFSDPAGPYAKYAYTAAKIILDVVKKHGIDDSDALVEAIRKIHYDSVLGEVTFDSHGQINLPVTADHYTVKDGKWVVFSGSGKKAQGDEK